MKLTSNNYIMTNMGTASNGVLQTCMGVLLYLFAIAFRTGWVATRGSSDVALDTQPTSDTTLPCNLFWRLYVCA